MALNADDYRKVEEMYARCNFALDDKNVNAWVGCFTEDGSLRITTLSGTTISEYSGKNSLRGYIQRVAENYFGSDRVRHWNNNIYIEETADAAEAVDVTSYLCIETTGARHTVLTTGIATDRLEKVGNAWLFRDRKIVLDCE